MKMAMMARNPDLYSHKRLVEAAEQRGHTLDIVNTLLCYMNITSHRPELRYKGEKLTGYDAVIPRIGASVTFYGLAVLRQRTSKAMGIPAGIVGEIDTAGNLPAFQRQRGFDLNTARGVEHFITTTKLGDQLGATPGIID